MAEWLSILTPEMVEALGKVLVGVITAIGSVLATVISAISAFFTWKNRYELDRLYSKTFRPLPDGSPGPMRKHPAFMIRMFERKKPKTEVKP
jgi:hypothetical protein